MRRAVQVLSILLLSAAASDAQQPKAPPSRARKTPPAAQTPQRVRLAPQFTPGLVLRYQMEFRTTTDGHRAGVVEDPQAASQLELTWSALVRLEVVSAEKAAAGASGRVRVRTTYEKSQATSRSDTYDPAAAALEGQYRKLEGRTIEFTLDAGGKVSDVSGLSDIVSDERAESAAREWLSQLAMGAALPADGIAPGQRWTAEQPTTSAPIAGTLLRTESTYLRNEKCRPAAVSTASSPPDSYATEACAVILTRFEMTQPHAPRDPTPEDYRKSGLRTAGTWTGSGESLGYVALRTGWVVSVTQSGEEHMDVTVSTADGESKVRYAGRVRTQSQVTLLPESPPSPAPR